jgi:4a-hydroxytetrahydrobiopterin dehydratase
LCELYSRKGSSHAVPRVLKADEVDQALSGLPGWRRDGKFVTKAFEFERFMDGIKFVGEVAKVAEEQEHHPDIRIRYTSVTLSLQTHSEGGVTEWDLDLAKAIEQAVGRGSTGLGPAQRLG